MNLTSTVAALGTSAALLTSSLAMAQLSISKDQGNQSPSVQDAQVKDGGGTMQAQTMQTQTQVMSTPNTGLNQVGKDAAVIFEVPVEIQTDGTLAKGTNIMGPEPDADFQLSQFELTCGLRDDYNYQTGDDPRVRASNSKLITLGPDGNYTGTVRIGVPITEDDNLTEYSQSRNQLKQQIANWWCYLEPHIPGRGSAEEVQGAAFNLRDDGEIDGSTLP